MSDDRILELMAEMRFEIGLDDCRAVVTLVHDEGDESSITVKLIYDIDHPLPFDGYTAVQLATVLAMEVQKRFDVIKRAGHPLQEGAE